MKIAFLRGFFLIIGLCGAVNFVTAASCDNPSRLRFSLVPQGDTRKDAASFLPLFEALERELGKPVDMIYPPSYGFVVEGLLAATIDIAFMGPASYASAKNSDDDVQAFASYSSKAGAFQEESSFYHSLLVVRNNSKFPDYQSLRATSLALVDPVSTSGAILPRYFYSALTKTTLEKYFGRVVYTGGHDKSALAVANGLVDAAFVASNHLSDFIGSGKARKEDYKVLWQSEEIPLDPFVYRGRLCAPIKEKIRKVFFADNGKKYLPLLQNLRADRLTPIGDESYKAIREILRATP
ncbi:MAG: phosphate/phosphite/phosphonate ABC transporter substrate-binding protein [Betaproteobacteria bacterium]